MLLLLESIALRHQIVVKAGISSLILSLLVPLRKALRCIRRLEDGGEMVRRPKTVSRIVALPTLGGLH